MSLDRISVVDVTKTFPQRYGIFAWLATRGAQPRRTALDGVSFNVAPGEIVGLLGDNGAGKSTLLRLIAGLIVADRGSVSVMGLDAARQPFDVRRHVGLCNSEERSFYNRLTARQNLELFAGLAEVPRPGRRARIEEVARDVDLEGDLDRRFDAYSSGMRQRLAVARAMLREPSVLLLDEPTRGVDPAHADDLRARVRRLVRERGISVMLATNVLDEAWDLCDRVVVLHAGRIVQTGSPAELQRRASAGRRYLISVDHIDDALLARTRAVEGVSDVDARSDGRNGVLSVGLDARSATLTGVLRAVSANGVAVRDIAREEPRDGDVFRTLVRGRDAG